MNSYPEVSESMLKPSYWYQKDCNRIIMTKEEITEYNKRLLSEQGEDLQLYDLENALCENALIKYGIVTDRTLVRAVPTQCNCSDSEIGLYSDKYQLAEIRMNCPVLITKKTSNNDWYYIFCEYYSGWVRACDIAICKNYAQWISWINEENFLVVTGDRIFTAYEPYSKHISNLNLDMGTKLILANEEEIPKLVRGRMPYSCYIVKIPTRDKSGSFSTELAFIPCSEDVSTGYLDYTQRNVLDLAFKLLGNTYGWGGMYNSNDCSGIIRQIYSCFGFSLPRDTKYFSKIKAGKIDLKNKSLAEKMLALDKLPHGSLINMPAHIMMYLGKEKGKYYVLNSTGGFMPENSSEYINLQCVTINPLTVKNRRGIQWIDMIESLLIIE